MSYFFGKNESKEMSLIEPTAAVFKSAKIEQQLHDDIYSAQDLLLKEATEILNTPDKFKGEVYERLIKLHELGFRNTIDVKETKDAFELKKRQITVKGYIDYYNKTYPLYKFIDEVAVATICQKYALYITDVFRYLADIPAKNQKEIVDFNVKKKDCREIQRGLVWHMQNMPSFGYHLDDNKKKEEMVSGRDLQIIAPESKLDTTGMTKVGHTFVKDDPIVLQPVHGGYLIVTSWGLEAADELIVNKINN